MKQSHLFPVGRLEMKHSSLLRGYSRDLLHSDPAWPQKATKLVKFCPQICTCGSYRGRWEFQELSTIKKMLDKCMNNENNKPIDGNRKKLPLLAAACYRCFWHFPLKQLVLATVRDRILVQWEPWSYLRIGCSHACTYLRTELGWVNSILMCWFSSTDYIFWWFWFRCHRKFPYHSQIEHVGKSAVPSGRRAELGNKMRVPDLNQRGSSTMNGEYFHRNCGYFSSQMSGLDL